jgi:AbiV family abortive infection protein
MNDQRCHSRQRRARPGVAASTESLSVTGRRARAYSLAVLAVEEFGKATGLVALAAAGNTRPLRRRWC